MAQLDAMLGTRGKTEAVVVPKGATPTLSPRQLSRREVLVEEAIQAARKRAEELESAQVATWMKQQEAEKAKQEALEKARLEAEQKARELEVKAKRETDRRAQLHEEELEASKREAADRRARLQGELEASRCALQQDYANEVARQQATQRKAAALEERPQQAQPEEHEAATRRQQKLPREGRRPWQVSGAPTEAL
eukprot:NODE_5134_length_1805_cov_1.766985.p3 GENE.NODE_5134_length_1805_cov_1.766985~~NODE_5134_length_1805_cov_1.766985.p3  ORF type:complete len:195 (-),score=69.47 NODE_5134_length_1805_cov_1.766985:158-742(-)